jgi:hypothetical protein
MRGVAILCAALTMLTVRAAASAPAAWNQHYAEVKKKCIAASGLLDAKALDFAGFPDNVGYDAVRIEGRYKSGAVGRMICLFNRATRKAVTVETTTPFPAK